MTADEIRNTILLLKRLEIEVDATAEFTARGKSFRNGELKIRENFLILRELRGHLENQPIEAWQIKSEPLLLERARITGMIYSVPSSWMNVKRIDSRGVVHESIKMSDDRRCITHYLGERLAIMIRDQKGAVERKRKAEEAARKEAKRAKEDGGVPVKVRREPLEYYCQVSHVIRFETIFKETGTKTGDRKKKVRLKDHVYAVLRFWKSQGIVKDWEKDPLQGRVTGVLILLMPPKARKP